MTSPAETQVLAPSTNGDAAAHSPSANGELINRVQQLRLDGQLGKGSGGGQPRFVAPLGAVRHDDRGLGGRGRALVQVGGCDRRCRRARREAGRNHGLGAGRERGGRADRPRGALVLQIKGTLTPFLQISLSPDNVAGVVTEINFKEGQRVKQGEVLAKIRDNRYLNDYNAAVGSLDSAKFRLSEMHPDSVREMEKEQAKAEWAEAEANCVRCKQEPRPPVHAAGVGGGFAAGPRQGGGRSSYGRTAGHSPQEGPRDPGRRAAQDKLLGAKADVANAEARLKECKRLLDNCEVRSPIDGTILTKVADPGVVVSPMSFNIASGICTLADLADMEAEIDVREDQIVQVQVGQECQVAAMANPNRVYRGRVDRIMPIADDTKNTIKVRVKVQLPRDEEPGSFLKPKMSTVVRVYNTQIPPFPKTK